MTSPVDETQDGRGAAVIGFTAIALLILVALLAGAVPYALALVGLAQLPFPGGLQALDSRDLLIRAGLVFLAYAVAEIPADFVGKLISTSTSLQDSPERRDTLKPRRIVQGRIVSHLLQAILLLNLLAIWVTASVIGAILAALVTVTIEFLTEPVLQRYSKEPTHE